MTDYPTAPEEFEPTNPKVVSQADFDAIIKAFATQPTPEAQIGFLQRLFETEDDGA